MDVISDVTIDSESIVLDGKHFVGCILLNCTLEYGGEKLCLNEHTS